MKRATMKDKILKFAALLILMGIGPRGANASIIFTFAEVGGTVTMTSSGTLDTAKLLAVSRPDGWGGTGIENNPTAGDIDIMGGTSFGAINTQFEFNAGTDSSAITNPGGPFTSNNFSPSVDSGSKSFTTYSGFIGAFRQPGIGMRASDIVAGLWTPNQNWTFASASFASLGLNTGTYAVSDRITGEGITIQVGTAAVPEPASFAIWGGIGIAGLVAWRRKRSLRSKPQAS